MASARSEVDTRRPFRSVKEAVAIFGERLLSGGVHPPSPKPRCAPPSPSYSRSEDDELNAILTSMKELEEELKETKHEVMLLKEKGLETEIAVASLNMELRKSRSKLGEMELSTAREGRWGIMEEMGRGQAYKYLPSLAEALRLEKADAKVNERSARLVKKKEKPIVPLIGDLFF